MIAQRSEETPPLDAPRQAVVVFVDRGASKLVACLRRGFRHCFVLVRRDGCWIVCDPLRHHTLLEVIDEWPAADLAQWYRAQGHHAVETTTVTPSDVAPPLRLFTCVEAVKRVLGLRAPDVFTPWQLYRRLDRVGK